MSHNEPMYKCTWCGKVYYYQTPDSCDCSGNENFEEVK